MGGRCRLDSRLIDDVGRVSRWCNLDNSRSIADRIVELANKGEHTPDFLGPIPEGRLRDAERDLDVTFSGSYRAFLLHLGGARMFGYCFCGLPEAYDPDSTSLYPGNLVDYTVDYRSFMEGLPSSYVYLTDNGGWITFWMDTAINHDGESPIVAFSYERLISICDSFLDFIDLFTHKEDLYKLFS
jgi:SMI1-KNR4 cell-wall